MPIRYGVVIPGKVESVHCFQSYFETFRRRRYSFLEAIHLKGVSMFDKVGKVLTSFCLLCSCPVVFGQQAAFFGHGSIVVIVREEHRILIGADSMEVWSNKKPTYDECKITPLGDSVVFSAVGHVNIGEKQSDSGISAHELAKTAFLKFKDVPNSDARTRNMADYWGKAVRDRMRAVAKYARIPVDVHNAVVTALFMSLPEVSKPATWPIYVVEITAKSPKVKGGSQIPGYIVQPASISIGYFRLLGKNNIDLVAEFVSGQTLRSASVWSKMQAVVRANSTIDANAFGIESAIAAVEEWAPKEPIGGKTDVLELTRSGFDWLVVKDNCREQ
jgi:hypothetical protein